jgi:hypothetical protein
MPGPVDAAPAALGTVQEAIRGNYKFLQKLFDPQTGAKLRKDLFNQKDEAGLRAFLGSQWLAVRPNVRLMLVDIENGQTKVYGSAIDPSKEEWYVLVLPPVPRRSKDPQYLDMQTWAEATFHATNDGYGM